MYYFSKVHSIFFLCPTIGYPSTPAGPGVVTTQYTPAPIARPPSPMFVSVPPRSQRLVHSEAYLRYIETLASDKPAEKIGNDQLIKFIGSCFQCNVLSNVDK